MRWKKNRAAAAEPTELREGAEPGGELRQELAENMGDIVKTEDDIVEIAKELAHPPPPAVRFQPQDYNLGSRFDAPHHGTGAAAHGDMPGHHDVPSAELDIVGGLLNPLLQSGQGAVEVYRRHHKAVHGSASELPQPGPSEQQCEQQRQQTEPDDDDRPGTQR